MYIDFNGTWVRDQEEAIAIARNHSEENVKHATVEADIGSNGSCRTSREQSRKKDESRSNEIHAGLLTNMDSATSVQLGFRSRVHLIAGSGASDRPLRTKHIVANMKSSPETDKMSIIYRGRNRHGSR